MSLARLAPLLAPIADQIVVTGRAAVDRHITRAPRRRATVTDRAIHVLSSWTLDRIAPALQEAGWERTGRAPATDRWRHQTVPDWTVTVQYVAGGGGDAEAWLEYATLLTTRLAVEPAAAIRLSSPVATLALLLAEWRASGESALDSAPLEDALQLMAGRPELDREIPAAPPELREFVRGTLGALARYRGVEGVLASAVAGARTQPLLAHRAYDRLRRLAEMPADGT
jgi:hypothetical protein